MPRGVYKRSPEHLARLRKHAEYMRTFTNTTVIRQHFSDEFSGEGNPNYKHGQDVGWYKHHKDARKLRHLLPDACERCQRTINLLIHHKDHDISNNDLSNLEILCRRCHSKEHPRGSRAKR